MKDEEVQAELVRGGGSAPQIELQAGEPVTLIGAVHGRDDVLASGRIWNNSKKTVVGVRVGWLIKTPGLPNETVLGKWTTLAGELASGEVASIPGQNVGVAPLKVAGTIMRFYIAEMKYQDGTVWQRNPESKAQPSTRSSILTAPSTNGTI